jgi:hypothetical protein
MRGERKPRASAKRAGFGRFAILFLLVSALAGCSFPGQAAKEGPARVASTVPCATLSVNLSSPRLVTGTVGVDVAASLTNCGDVALPPMPGGCAQGFALVVSQEARAYAFENGSLHAARNDSATSCAAPGPGNLAPGETRTVSVTWNGTLPGDTCTNATGVHGTASVCGTSLEDAPAGAWKIEASYVMVGLGITTYRWSAERTVEVQPRPT